MASLIGFAIGHYGPRPMSELMAQESGNVDRVREQLKTMNQVLDHAIAAAGKNQLSGQQLENTTGRLHALKVQALADFPVVFGRGFEQWYLDLEALDSTLSHLNRLAPGLDPPAAPNVQENTAKLVLRNLMDAKHRKEEIENRLPPS